MEAIKTTINVIFVVFVVYPLAILIGWIPRKAVVEEDDGLNIILDEYLTDDIYYQRKEIDGIEYIHVKGITRIDVKMFSLSTSGAFVLNKPGRQIFIFNSVYNKGRDYLKAVLLHEAGHAKYQDLDSYKTTSYYKRQWHEIQADWNSYTENVDNAVVLMSILDEIPIAERLVLHGPRLAVLAIPVVISKVKKYFNK